MQEATSLFRSILNRLSLDFGPDEFELEDADIERDLQYGRGELQLGARKAVESIAKAHVGHFRRLPTSTTVRNPLKLTLSSLCLVAVVTVAVASCAAPAHPAGEETAARPVVTTTVAERTWHETIDLTAEIAPWAAVTVAAETSGRVLTLPVDHGDRVTAGDPVAHLDTANAQAEVYQARARRQSAEASLAQAQRDLDRGRTLDNGGIISAGELDRLTVTLETAEAALQEAAAALTVADERLADTVVRAPFEGVVSERMVEIGSWVTPGSPVVRLVDRDRLKARASASQGDRVRLDVGAAVTVRADALSDTTFEGRIRFLGQEADLTTGTYLVEVEVPAAGPNGALLLPGMQGVMTAVLAIRSDLVIPRSAVLSTRAGASVFVVEDGVARRREVTVESVGPGEVAVGQGLSAGDLLVVQGQHRLADGDAVEGAK